ncbi:unnamed protein product [Polarella glacialis]|uniref:Chloroplast soluble peridinin-chlorophyll a-binding protein n=1 Tax=Polarella glacialis TaxID=89957 RepID=A0A813KQB9_POLGL|nr:unnamed protein product [Polarella glacialis]
MAKLLPCVVAMVAVLALCNWLPAFVPPPAGQSLRHGVHMSTAVGAAAVLGAAPAAFADKIDDAATKLSEASYPFLKEIDWTSNVYGSLPNANPVKVLAVINKALVMGASMDSAALKKGVLAHASAIGHVDSKGMIPCLTTQPSTQPSATWLPLCRKTRSSTSSTQLAMSSGRRKLVPT